MQTWILDDAAAVARAVAEDVADHINHNPDTLVCLAAGDTPLPAYRILIDMQREGRVDLNKAYYIGLDEWVGLGMEDVGSCVRVMREAFYDPAGIRPDRMRLWDGLCADVNEEIARMNNWLSERGTIGLSLLGVGMNGHVGFCEPNCELTRGGACIALDDVTKRVSKKYFHCERAVTRGIGVGLGELLAAERTLLIATGAHKADIIHKTLAFEPSPAVPSSMFQTIDNAALYLDASAAGKDACAQ